MSFKQWPDDLITSVNVNVFKLIVTITLDAPYEFVVSADAGKSQNRSFWSVKTPVYLLHF